MEQVSDTPGLTIQVESNLKKLFMPGRKKGLDKRALGKTPYIYHHNTLKTYICCCIVFAKWVKSNSPKKVRSLIKIQEVDVRNYLRHMIDSDYSPYTIKKHGSGIAKLGDAMGRSNWRAVVLEELRNVHRGKTDRAYGDRAKDIIDIIENEQIKIILMLAWRCGLRISEATGARIENVDGNLLSVKGKGGLYRTVEMDEYIGKRINELAGSRERGKIFKIVNEKVQRALRDACHSLGIEPKGVHGLRHDYARNRMRTLTGYMTEVEAKGAVSAELGHRRAEITDAYMGVISSNKKNS